MNTSVICLIALAFIGSASALDCYICAAVGSLGAECNDPFDAAKNANATSSSCSGFCIKTTTSVGDVATTARSCAAACTESSVDAFGVKSEIKCCNSNLCNGAETTAVSKIVMSIFSMVAVAYMF